jgi:hypothetical protein
MANTKISALTAATTPVAGTEVLPIVQSSATKQLSIANLTPGLSTITAAKGGTGQTSFAVGDLLYADTTTTLAKLADVATGNALISGGVTTAPSWGKIGLTTHVSGTLPVANGGTGVTSLTAGYIPFGAGTSAFGSSANLFWDNTNARLGIGTSSPGYKLDVNGAVSVSGITSGTGNKIYFDTTSGVGANTIGTVNDYDLRLECGRGSTSQIYVATDSVKFNVAAAERMRIDSSGLLVGTTAQLFAASSARLNVDSGGNGTATFKTSGGSAQATLYSFNSATTGDNAFISFGTEGTFTQRGSITYNRAGGLVAYNVTSDYRAKDIIGPVTDSGTLIDSVPVYMGKMKGATQERPMFIAHETPVYAHTGEKDAVDADGNPVYQQMDASALIPVMWAEIQSLRKRLTALEAR